MTNKTPHNPADESQNVEQRLGQVTGERICHKCTFILTGQTIIREPKYDLLIVRCPECGAVTPMHEYPALSRWSRRLTAAAAGALLLFVFALWMGNAGLFCGMGIAAAEGNSARLADMLNDMHMDEINSGLYPTSSDAVVPPAGIPNPDFANWLDEQSAPAILGRAGFSGLVDYAPELIAFLGLSIVLAFPWGLVWSIVLIRRGWFAIGIWTLVILGTATFFSSFALLDWIDRMQSGAPQRYFFRPTLLVLTLMLQAGSLYVTVFLGRPLVRGLVRLLVPPKLWPSLHWLWTVRGLEPPKYRP